MYIRKVWVTQQAREDMTRSRMCRLIVVLSVVMVVVALSEVVTGAPSDSSHLRVARDVEAYVRHGSPAKYSTSGAVTSHGGWRPPIYRGNRHGNRYNRYGG
ncbi:uncharacterized protein LOC135116511 isoform X2 [Scylla paramamosain]|uniref:uncharacterized protein LOC135116511 isoform X2 n=1 Tax=Scylla paramamosain TaxID=85552 RepID=UPI003083E4FC